MMPYSLPEPVGANPRHFTLMAIALCMLALALLVARVTHWQAHLSSDLARARTNQPVSLTVGEASFKLPIDYISSAGQRRASLASDSRFKTLKLTMAWPDLRAYTDLNEAGASLNDAKAAIRVELESNPGRESMRARLDPFYRRLARGGELTGPGGLKLLALSPYDSHNTDMIVYDPTQQNGFIARCRRNSTDEPAQCHRAVVLSRGLEVRYTFDQALLADWRQLDRAVVRKVREFRTL